jgi:hypothetical protein
LHLLTSANLAHVQLCDLAGVPRELAADADRIMPGDGDFLLGPIIEHLHAIGYSGWLSRIDESAALANQTVLGRGNRPGVTRTAAPYLTICTYVRLIKQLDGILFAVRSLLAEPFAERISEEKKHAH